MSSGTTGNVTGRMPLATVLTQLHAGLAAGQSPAALHAVLGPAVAAAVWGMPGGAYAPALDVVRPWTRGVAVDAVRFAASVETLLAGCATPTEFAAAAVFSGRRYYVGPQGRHGPAHFDDAGFAVFATPVGTQRVDPLLDNRAVCSSFAQLEDIVAGGHTLALPGLGLWAYAPPGTRLVTLTDLYARLRDGASQLWLLERLLYVIPTTQVTPALATTLQTAADNGGITRVTALTIDASTTEHPTPPLPFLVPAIAREGEGAANVAQLLADTRAYWLSPTTRAPLRIDSLIPVPTLAAWIQTQTALLHPTDLRRLEQVHQALGQAPGHVSAGQVTAAVDHVVGICAEIALRPAVIAAFEAAAGDTTVGLWVEGELATPDGKRISDALLLKLDLEHRRAQIHTAWELAAGPSGTSTADAQHTHTVQERLPAQGLILEHGATAWARVAADTTTTQRITHSLDPAAARDLRRMAEQAIAESLAYWAFHTAVHGTIPADERRHYRGVRGRTTAGVLWNSIVTQLWAIALARPGPFDLPALVAQIESRLRHFPLAGRPLVAAELACLHNLAVPLHPTGPRRSAEVLATAIGVAATTIIDVQTRLTAALTAAHIPVHDDPTAKLGTAIRAGTAACQRVEALLTTWQALPSEDRTALALASALDIIITRAAPEDTSIAIHLTGWGAALRNLAMPLNPAGPRQSTTTLATTTGVSYTTIGKIQARLTAALTAARIPVHADPEIEQTATRQAGAAVTAQVEDILRTWHTDSTPTAFALAEALNNAVDTATDTIITKFLAAWCAALQNLAVPLRPSGSRRSVVALVTETGISAPKMAKIQARLTVALTAAHIPVHDDPEAARGTNRRVWTTANQRVEALLTTWQALPPADRPAAALASALDTARTATDDAAVASCLAAWHTALHNLAVPLHPAGPRQTATALARMTSVSPQTIQKIQTRLTAALTAAQLAVHDDPEAARSAYVKAGHARRKADTE